MSRRTLQKIIIIIIIVEILLIICLGLAIFYYEKERNPKIDYDELYCAVCLSKGLVTQCPKCIEEIK